MKNKREQLIEESAKRIADRYLKNPEIDLNDLMKEAANDLNELLAEIEDDPENEERRRIATERTKSLLQKMVNEYNPDDIMIIGRIQRQESGNYECRGICQGEHIKIIALVASLIHSAKIDIKVLEKAVHFESLHNTNKSEEFEFIQKKR